jgi:hypothetical protein
VEVLLSIADLTGVELGWLATGRQTAGPTATADNPVVRRAAALLAKRPNSAAALAAFLEILSQTAEFPENKEIASAEPGQPADHAGAKRSGRAAWIPIVGRSAAGLPQFWVGDEGGQTTKLQDVIDRYSGHEDAHVRPARADEDGTGSDKAVQVVTVTDPPPGEVAEFIAAAGIKHRWPNAFAVRIDGESMAPDIRHGDLVVLSPSEPAANGQAAVIQLKDQIGVTCKIYRRSGAKVHLVPINEQFEPQSFPARMVVWAFRVLARIRPE